MTNGYLLLYHYHQDDDYRLYSDDDGGNDGDYTWAFSKNGTSPGSSKNLGTTPNVKLTASSMFGSLKVIFWTSGIGPV